MTATTLWNYALRHYAQPGVAPACLLIQENWQVDIPILLYAGWMGAAGRRLSAGDLASVDAVLADWRDQVIRPLRRVRTAMKHAPYPVAPAPASALRESIKAAELQAERLELETLERDFAAIGRAGTPPDEAVGANVPAVIAHFAGAPLERPLPEPVALVVRALGGSVL